MKNEAAVRLACFAGTFLLVAAWEALCPRRPRLQTRRARWTVNLGFMVLDTLILRLSFPVLAAGFAYAAEARGLGLLNQVSWPFWTKFWLGFAALDLVIYLQHRAFHRVPLFWRFHRVHHADLDFDASTGVRFHPVEILLSMGIKLGAVALIGPHFLAVVAFEVVLNASALFNHANASLPSRLEPLVRLLVVTPDMHRVHHSVLVPETNSNYGFNFPWWDRLFGTYRASPEAGHDGMTIGLPEHRDASRQGLGWALALPFRSLP